MTQFLRRRHCHNVGETLTSRPAAVPGDPHREKSVSGPGGPVRLSGGGEQPFVELAGSWAGRDAELLAQALAELAVNVEGFGQVVLGGEGLHEVAVAAFPEGSEADELPAGPDRGGELGSADAQPGCRVALQGAQAEHRQLVADLVDPGGFLAG